VAKEELQKLKAESTAKKDASVSRLFIYFLLFFNFRFLSFIYCLLWFLCLISSLLSSPVFLDCLVMNSNCLLCSHPSHNPKGSAAQQPRHSPHGEDWWLAVEYQGGLYISFNIRKMRVPFYEHGTYTQVLGSISNIEVQVDYVATWTAEQAGAPLHPHSIRNAYNSMAVHTGPHSFKTYKFILSENTHRGRIAHLHSSTFSKISTVTNL
jgi:hypothetical protein